MRPGDRIGPLRVERPLGTGGMGEVYLARDERLDRPVALKVLSSARTLDPEARGRMLREARAASALRHPGIVTVYDIGEHEGRTYIAMEYVEGETLEEVVRRRGPLPPAEAVDLVAKIADALATAHDAGVLHRDIKSANLMVDGDGRVKVLDFGLSKRTRGAPLSGQAAAVQLPRRDDDGGGDRDRDESGEADLDRSGEADLDRSAELAVEATVNQRGVRASGPLPVVPVPEPAEAALGTPPGASEDEPTGDGADLASAPTASPGPDSAGRGRSTSSDDELQTVHGARMGTPGWAPPELIDGKPADIRSDVFSLGVVLYHVLTARLPFRGGSWSSVRKKIAKGPIPPSQCAAAVPVALDAVVLSALAFDPARRPADVRALVALARAALQPRRPWRRVAVAGAAATAALGAIAVMAIPRRGGPNTPAAPAPPATRAAMVPTTAPAATIERLTRLGGCAYSPAFLDDGSVTFDLTRGGAVDLYRLTLGAEPPQQLTRDPGWEWASGRGRAPHEVMFLREVGGAKSIQALDVVTGARALVVGNAMSFAFAAGTLYYAPTTGGEIRRRRDQRDESLVGLSAGEMADLITATRDGARVAMGVRTASSAPRICVVSTADPEVRCPPIAASNSLGRPAFSSDGASLYFASPAGIGRLRLADDRQDVVIPGGDGRGGLAVAPDGRVLVGSACGSTTELVDVVAAPDRPLFDEAGLRSPAFGPDGRLAYVRIVGNDSQIAVREPDGTLRELARRPAAVITDLAFSPDGRSIAFVLENTAEPGLYLASTEDSRPPNRLTEDPGDIQPLFVGSDLVFARLGPDRVPRLMRIGADGSGARVVSARPRLTIGVDRLGRRVLLASPDLSWLYWWDPQSGAESPGPPAHPADGVLDIALSPDGQWLIYVAGNNGQETWRLRLDGKSQPVRIHQLADDVNVRNGAVDDRGHAVIAVHRWAGELWLVRAPDGSRW